MHPTIDDFRFGIGPRDSPFSPTRQWKCPMNDLPNEILSCVFQVGVEIEQEKLAEGEGEGEGEGESIYSWWEDVGDEAPSFVIPKWVRIDDDRASVDSNESLCSAGLSEGQVAILPFQVLVSHVCRCWRSVALNTPRLWTTLTFNKCPKLVQMKEYISRSNGRPLTIDIDYYEEDDIGLNDDLDAEEKRKVLALEKLDQILDLLEPTVSQWRKFDFSSADYVYPLIVMPRLDKLPPAPCLESFQVHNVMDIADIDLAETHYTTHYLPFHGQVPNLKDVAIRELPINWEAASSNFLRGLHKLELTSGRNDIWPTYAAFAEIINNSPDLHSLTLSGIGPILPNSGILDSHVAWGPVPLSLPSLTRLVLDNHSEIYATALFRHLDMPNLTHLAIDGLSDSTNCSCFLQALAEPVKGRSQGLLRQITHLKLTSLSFDSKSTKVLLSELISLKSVSFQLDGPGEDKLICDALTDPRVLVATGPASIDPSGFFCPKLEEIEVILDEERAKALITQRRDAGVPLKRIRPRTRLIGRGGQT